MANGLKGSWVREGGPREVRTCSVHYHVLLRLGLNLKLIKDMQQHSLLTWLFTFPSPFFFSNPFIHPSVLQWSLSLRTQADGRGRAAWCQVVNTGETTGKQVGGSKRAKAMLTMQQWPFPGLLLDVHVHFSRSLTLLAVDHTKKSSDVSSPTFPHYS